MRITTKKLEEIVVWEYFMPTNCKWSPKTDDEIIKFFQWSEQGKHKDIYFKLQQENPYHIGLREGKRWAGIHWQMYEDGVLEGSMPYFTILGGYDISIKRKWWQFWKPKYTFYHRPVPREVVNQMKKEMFKGIDSEIIERCYQNILEESNK